MMPSGRGSLRLILFLLLAVPVAAQAQDSPRLDPDSPAGVEYKLPFDQARRDAVPDGGGGGGPGSGGGSGDAPLFGAGIEPHGARNGGGDTEAVIARAVERPDRGQSDGGGESGSTGGGDAAGSGPGGAPPALTTTAAEAGGSATGLLLGGVALAVLVLGGALGLALRRGLGSPPAP